MRTITTAAADVLAGPLVPCAALVQMDLSSTVRLCTGGHNLTYSAQAYSAVGGLGNVGAAQEAGGTPQGLQFTLSGVPASQVALALAEPVQGKACTIRLAVLDPATYAVLDAPVEWAGTLDTMTLADEPGAASITVTAEHAGVDLLRAVPVRYSDTDQQRLFAGDLGFQFVTDQANRTIVWPAASFFRR
jgi:hypothetical protein